MKFDVQAFINNPRVLTKRKDGLVIFNYDHACTYDRAWDDITMQARGLILEEATGEVVFRNMKKFFNLGEVEATRYENLPPIGFTATEKMDGYLGCAFKWRDQWHVATRGSFDSEMAQWATPWFRANVRTDAMDPEYSYHFEVIYSRKIVISYDFEGLVLLTAVHKETGREMPYLQLVQDAKAMGVRVTPLMPQFGTLLELAEYVKALPHTKEGCVVTFNNGLKVKIKGSEYCRIHKIICRMTPLAFWEAYDTATGKIPRDYLLGIPEEFRETSDALLKAIEGRTNDAVVEVEAVCKAMEDSLPPGVDEKTFALKTREIHPDKFDWIMRCHKGQMERLRWSLHRKFRPKANEMVGNIPGLDRIQRVAEEG